MRCPNCSNEISLEETFCGQCGTPVILSTKPIDPTNRQGLLSSGYYSANSPASDTYKSGMRPSSNNQPPMMLIWHTTAKRFPSRSYSSHVSIAILSSSELSNNVSTAKLWKLFNTMGIFRNRPIYSPDATYSEW